MAKRPTSRSSFDPEAVQDNPISQGNNYLLTIGIDEYEHCAKLNNAVGDARDLVRLLQKKYQFETQRSFTCYNGDATWEGIDQAFDHCAETIEAPDNLVIYFSGHGHYEPKTEGAYWIPSDARYQRVQDYYSYDRITRRLKAIRSQHTFLIVDSCYSGAVLIRDVRSGMNRLERDPSRWILASGRNEVVPDGVVGGHSPFASQLLDVLNRYAGDHLPVMELVTKVTTAVVHNARQTPIGCPLRDVGDKGGQFVFRPKIDGTLTDPHLGAWDEAAETNTVDAYFDFIENHPRSSYVREARSRISALYQRPADLSISAAKPIRPVVIRPSHGTQPIRITEGDHNMIFIPGGTFLMGSPETEVGRFDNETLHEVSLGDYYLTETQVTVKAYRDYCEAVNFSMPDEPSWGWKEDAPIVQVSWNDALVYCQWLSQQTGNNYRLPTEAEWEYAAAGGLKGYDEKGNRRFIWAGTSDEKELTAYAWFTRNTDSQTHPVGQKTPNPLGLYDMSGNIWEWCADRYGEYLDAFQRDPTGPDSGVDRVLRGGSWLDGPQGLRVAYRLGPTPDCRLSIIGFRLARTP